MKNKILALYARYKDVLLYVFFGIGTTAINFAVFSLCHYTLNIAAAISNVICWFCSVVFAFVTNKPFVFHSMDWSPEVAFPEFVRFVGCRLSSLGLETVFVFFTVDMLKCSGIVMKILISGVVIAVNYVGSKLLVFGGKGKKGKRNPSGGA